MQIIFAVMMIRRLRIVAGSSYVPRCLSDWSWESSVKALFDLSSKFKDIGGRRQNLRPRFGVGC